MPPRRKKARPGETSIKWDTQPIVEKGTHETPYGFRLQARECPPTRGKAERAQLGRLRDNGSWEKLGYRCVVTIGQATQRDKVLETYLKHYDEETMEAAAATREEQGRAAVEAAVAASDAMGGRGGRAARSKSDGPAETTQRLSASTLTQRKNRLLAKYYRDRGVTTFYDQRRRRSVLGGALGGGSGGLLDCVWGAATKCDGILY